MTDSARAYKSRRSWLSGANHWIPAFPVPFHHSTDTVPSWRTGGEFGENFISLNENPIDSRQIIIIENDDSASTVFAGHVAK